MVLKIGKSTRESYEKGGKLFDQRDKTLNTLKILAYIRYSFKKVKSISVAQMFNFFERNYT